MDNFIPSDETREGRRTLLFLVLALLFLVISSSIGGYVFASTAGFKPGTIWARLRTLTLSRDKMLKGEPDDRINVLLLGMGGGNNEGPTLTDTLIFASIRPSDGKVGLLSIPRDLQVLIPKYGYRKINHINALAEAEAPGSGAQAATDMVSQILDQSIHYFLRVDFKAFTEIIDEVGEVEVNVERSFVDLQYPDDEFGFERVEFKAGKQRMDGERALKYARSRHGGGGEGNDFARAARQQKVLLALKDRLLSFDMLLRPGRIKNISASLSSHIQTNIAFGEGMRFAKLLRHMESGAIVNRVLDASPDGLLVERTYNGAFVLEPQSGTWNEIREVAAELLQ